MEKEKAVERAKTYLSMLLNGVHPVTGQSIPEDSALMDEKVKNCFAFLIETLDDYGALCARVEQMEKKQEELTVVVQKKLDFAITHEQCESIALSKEPLTVLSFMKNVNAVIDAQSMEKLSSTRINKWLVDGGWILPSTVQTVVNKTVYKPSETAEKIGIFEEQTVDKKTGEVKSQVKLSQSAQLFIIENLESIVKEK